MKDPFGRAVNSIRISINHECNLKCFYCHGEGQNEGLEKMSPGEIETILMVAKEFGISKVKFTGGEPLLRKDLPDIIRRTSKHMNDVSLTSNGTLLGPLAKILHDAGLTRINISLDTLDEEKYRKITGKKLLEKVLEGISAAVRSGLHPVKINIVALSDTSVDDLMKIIREAWRLHGIPQIIEQVDMNSAGYPDITDVENFISNLAVSEKERRVQGRKIYTIEDEDNNVKDVEIVRPMHNTRFCSKCSRIRVTSHGLLKPCLMHNHGLVDILTPIRQGESMEKLISLFQKAIMNRYPYWR